MSALMRNEDHGTLGCVHIVARLQMLRRQVHDSLRRDASQIPSAATTEILAGVLGVAIAARGENLNGFTSICMLVYERVERFERGGRLPRPLLGLIVEWSANSELYLRRPSYAEFAKDLVHQLSDPRWGTRLDRAAQDGLTRALLACRS